MDQTNEAEVLLFEKSPFGNLDAIVQHNGRVVYFYLAQPQSATGRLPRQPGIQACWVRNLEPGPYVFDQQEVQQGVPPLLPRSYCRSTEPGRLPRPEQLEVVWFEEGNGAALTESAPSQSRETLAVIPPWSGLDGFHGYARDCVAENEVCWPMPDNPKLQQRIDRARQFWNSFQSQPNPFAGLQAETLQSYRDFFGAGDGTRIEEDYFSIDGGNFPPRGLVALKSATAIVLATVGMSLCPMPAVELFSPAPNQDRRIELAMELPADSSAPFVETAIGQISGIASLPWQQFTWLGDGHTCQFPGVWPQTETARLIAHAALYPNREIRLPVFRDDPVKLLWLKPDDVHR